MRTSRFALAGFSLAAALAFATPATADPSPPTGTYLGGCDTSISPGALDCDGYYSKNVLNTDEASIIQGAVANLGGTWDGDWDALVGAGYGDLTTLSGPLINQLAFPTTLYGEKFVGIHFGNVADDACRGAINRAAHDTANERDRLGDVDHAGASSLRQQPESDLPVDV